MKRITAVLLALFMACLSASAVVATEGSAEAIAPLLEQITTELTPQQQADLVIAVGLHLMDNGESSLAQAAMEVLQSSLSGDTGGEQPAQAPGEANGAAPTQGESNALRSAQQYLSFMPFSHSGLVAQLEYEGYSNTEAVYAADHCGADWNLQAEKSAAQYLDLMAFSRSGLIDQLMYEGYTKEQAEYGAEKNGY